MQHTPSPETSSLLDQIRPLLSGSLYQQLEEELTNWIQISQDFRQDRKQALEHRDRLQRERDQMQTDCIRYREERNHARRERDMLKALLSDEQPSIRVYLNGVLDALIALSGAQKGIVWLFSSEGETRGEPAELVVRNCDEEDIAVVREQLELSQGIVRRALSTRSLVYTEEALTDQRFAEHASVRLLRLKTVLCAPLLGSDGRGLGVLYLEHRGRANAFPESDRQLIELVVAHVTRWVSRQMIVTRVTETLDYTTPYRERYGFKEIVGKSEELAEVLRLMTLSLDLNSIAPVLITGESGTGKELAARALHFNSHRARGPFTAINCGTVPEDQIESTLFGHARGAFAGADRNQPGKFEASNSGTLFLDEVGEMSLSAQAKLLRVLQDREVVRLGDHAPRPVDVRVIAATHRDLRALIRQGLFREDLFFRLDVFPIHIPPLRERRDDIPLISEHFVALLSQAADRPLSLSSDAIAFLQQCDLPGNARELHSRLSRASMHAADGLITASLLLSVDRPGGAAAARGTVRALPTWKDATSAFQRQLLVDALRKTNRNLQEAAEMLGISRQHLSRLLHELDLNDHRPAHRGRKPRSEHGG